MKSRSIAIDNARRTRMSLNAATSRVLNDRYEVASEMPARGTPGIVSRNRLKRLD